MNVLQENRKALKAKILENCTVVLVEPGISGNVGSAARAMKNMGLTRLKLVRPVALAGDCEKMAVGAIDVVKNADHFDSLDDALKDEQVVVGTTSNRGRTARRRVYTPRTITPLIWDYARRQRVAIVFGPERRGLSLAQLAGCQYLVSIPGDPSFPTLNLAQSVLVLSYELYTFEGVVPAGPSPRIASHRKREGMFEHMQRVLLEIGFLDPNNPGHIMRSIRRFLGKADLTPRDVSILRGIMSQIEWYSVRNSEEKPRHLSTDSEADD